MVPGWISVADQDHYQKYYFPQYYSLIGFAPMKLTLLKQKQPALICKLN